MRLSENPGKSLKGIKLACRGGLWTSRCCWILTRQWIYSLW